MGSGRWQRFSGFVGLIGGLVMTSSWIIERQHLTGREKGEWGGWEAAEPEPGGLKVAYKME